MNRVLKSIVLIAFVTDERSMGIFVAHAAGVTGSKRLR